MLEPPVAQVAPSSIDKESHINPKNLLPPSLANLTLSQTVAVPTVTVVVPTVTVAKQLPFRPQTVAVAVPSSRCHRRRSHNVTIAVPITSPSSIHLTIPTASPNRHRFRFPFRHQTVVVPTASPLLFPSPNHRRSHSVTIAKPSLHTPSTLRIPRTSDPSASHTSDPSASPHQRPFAFLAPILRPKLSTLSWVRNK
nr:hypothetical protein CFP56_05584 [Quercus suber]